VRRASAGLLCVTSILAAGIAYPADIKKPPPQTCPEPKNDEVAVRSASGQCAVKGPGIYSTSSAIGLGDEPIDVIFVGSFADAAVCGLDTFSHLECKKVTWSGGWRGGKNFEKLPSVHNKRWTFLQVARWGVDLECRPKDAEVTISGTSDGIGPCIRLGPGAYKTPEELGLADLPFGSFSKQVDKLLREGKLLLKQNGQNVQVGAKMQAKMCTGDNFLPNCMNGSQRGRYMFNDSIFTMGCLRSMKVWNVCVRRENQVALFGEPNAFGPCTIREVGEYLTAETLKIEGGAIRSIEMGLLVEARACSDENMNGECVDIKERMNVTWTIRSLTVRAR
jgi:hypothetical protein